MSEGTIGLIIIGLFVAVLLFGFLFGLWRGFNKSTVRLLFVAASIVGAFFLAPVVSKWALGLDLSNFGIKIGEQPVKNLAGLIEALLKDVPYIQEITGTDAYKIIMEVVPQMIANVVLFVVLFYLIRLVTMIFYWIVAGVCFNKKKTEGKNKHRLLGSVIGVVQNFAVFLVLLVPVFGIVGILGQVETIVTNQTEASSGTESAQTSISDEHSYVVHTTDEVQDGEHAAEATASPEDGIVSIYNTVNDVIKIYKNTWVAKFMSALKLDKLCEGTFDKLSTITKDGEKYELKNEIVSAAYVYTDYKAFREIGEIDVTNQELYKVMQSAIKHAYQSKLAAKFIDEIVPQAATTLLEPDGEFFGITLNSIVPNEPYQSVVKSALAVIADNERTLSETLENTASMMASLANTAAAIQEATEAALTPETITDLLEAVTSNPEVISIVADVLLEPDKDGHSNLEKLTDAIIVAPEDASEEQQEQIETIKGAVNEIVTSVVEGAENLTQEQIGNEIAVVGSALDLADKIMNSSEEAEITPKVVKDAVTQVVQDLAQSTVIYEALTGDSAQNLKDIVQQQISDYNGTIEVDGEQTDITDWIEEVTTPPAGASTETIAKLNALRELLTPST